ncbi:MAG TPA: hypothetical protein VMI12_16025 [Puia sp.]|nr:hypothetical protein [Puia sp.]
MRILIIIALFVAGIGCQRKMTYEETETQLKKAMSAHLYNSVKNDSSKVKFYIKEVTFFEDKDFFDCQFKVQMLERNLDTTGIMTARITKDFSKVYRNY